MDCYRLDGVDNLVVSVEKGESKWEQEGEQ